MTRFPYSSIQTIRKTRTVARPWVRVALGFMGASVFLVAMYYYVALGGIWR